MWINLDAAGSQSPTTENIAGTSFLPPDIGFAGGTIDTTFITADGAAQITESTILRIRGYVSIPKSSPTTTDDFSTVFAFGVGVVTEEAAFSGGDAIPNPATKSGASWDGWMFLRSSSEVAVDVQGTMLDIKAKRKFQSGTALIFVAGMATSKVAGETAQPFLGSLRALFLLP